MPVVEQFHDGLCQRLPISSLEQDAGLVVFDEFLVATDVRSDEKLALGHGFQRLQRRHEFSQAHRVARVGEDVDQIVITIYVLVWHTAGKDHNILEAGFFGLLAQVFFLRAAANEQNANIGFLFNDGWEGFQQ